MTEELPLQTGGSAQIFDELLVTMIQSGDRKAADRLVKRWHPRLLRAARRYANDAGVAEQLVQDCWVGIWRGIDSLRDPGKFAPWAFAILRNKGTRIIKAQIADRAHVGEHQEIAAAPALEERAAINLAFAALSPDHRLAAHLFFVEGLSLREIAAVQKIPVGTAKTRLFHARKKLKVALTENNFEGEAR